MRWVASIETISGRRAGSLAHAVEEPESFYDYRPKLMDLRYEPRVERLVVSPPTELPKLEVHRSRSPNRLELGTTWHALHYLMTGFSRVEGSPLSFLLYGGARIEPEEDLEDGGVFSVAHCSLIAKALAGLSEDDIRRRFDPVRMVEAEIYGLLFRPAYARGCVIDVARWADWYARLYSELRGLLMSASGRRGLLCIIWEREGGADEEVFAAVR